MKDYYYETAVAVTAREAIRLYKIYKSKGYEVKMDRCSEPWNNLETLWAIRVKRYFV